MSIGLSILTLPLTIIQFQALFGFGARPIRLDYLVFAWAAVPWLYRRADPFDFLRLDTWRTWIADGARHCARPAQPTGGALTASGRHLRTVLAPALADRMEEQRPDGEPDRRDEEREARVRAPGRRSSPAGRR